MEQPRGWKVEGNQCQHKGEPTLLEMAWSARSVVRYFLLDSCFDFGILYEFWPINLLLHHSRHFGSQEAGAAVIGAVWALSQFSKKFSEEVSHIENKIEITEKKNFTKF